MRWDEICLHSRLGHVEAPRSAYYLVCPPSLSLFLELSWIVQLIIMSTERERLESAGRGRVLCVLYAAARVRVPLSSKGHQRIAQLPAIK
jgi:hypothetical protein